MVKRTCPRVAKLELQYHIFTNPENILCILSHHIQNILFKNYFSFLRKNWFRVPHITNQLKNSCCMYMTLNWIFWLACLDGIETNWVTLGVYVGVIRLHMNLKTHTISRKIPFYFQYIDNWKNCRRQIVDIAADKYPLKNVTINN